MRRLVERMLKGDWIQWDIPFIIRTQQRQRIRSIWCNECHVRLCANVKRQAPGSMALRQMNANQMWTALIWLCFHLEPSTTWVNNSSGIRCLRWQLATHSCDLRFWWIDTALSHATYSNRCLHDSFNREIKIYGALSNLYLFDKRNSAKWSHEGRQKLMFNSFFLYFIPFQRLRPAVVIIIMSRNEWILNRRCQTI